MLKRPVLLGVEGITLSGQLFLPDGDKRYPAVCICHGIPSGKPADPADGGYPALAEEVCRRGWAAMIFSFRGAGASGGNLDILGWTRDLKAAIDYLCALPDVDGSRLALLGFSGGAAVSICVAAGDGRVASVAACASPAEFDFFQDGGDPQQLVDYFRGIGTIRDDGFPPSVDEWFRGFGLVSPIKYVGGIAPRPLLLVHGSRDETVAVSHAYRLYESAGEPRQLEIIEGAGHRLRRDGRAMAPVFEWLQKRSRD